MIEKGSKWRQNAFKLVMVASLQFVVLTGIAMLVHPGGTFDDPAATRYQFFKNFFSELGLTVSRRGEPNTVSAVLFFVALTVAGLGLVLFFMAMPGLFRGSGFAYPLSIAGSVAGVISGLSFVGVAFTPANLLPHAHLIFVQWAFVSFLIAAIFYSIAIFLNKAYPNGYGFVFVAFTVLLGTYVWLLFFGPGLESESGFIIQVTGQKIIGYAAIISACIQAYGAERLLRIEEGAQSNSDLVVDGQLST